MTGLRTVVAAIFLAIMVTSASASTCAPYPIPLRIGNISLPNNQIARGVELSIGEPPQKAAFLPLWPLNNTLLYGTNGHCQAGVPNQGPWTDDGCTTFRGGAYDFLASKTRKQAVSDAFADDKNGDGFIGSPAYPEVTKISDGLRLTSNVTLEDFPLEIALNDWGSQAYLPMMGLGLGLDSTLLKTLKSSNRILSRSWGFFWGRSTPGLPASRQLDGSLVLGGYDRAKVSGPGFTQSLVAPGSVSQCPSQMVVTISDIMLNFSNGTNRSIFPSSSSSAMATCLTPSLPALMRLPLDPYFDNMMQLTKESIFRMDRSTGIYFWNMRYRAGHVPYDGDLTISLQSGLSVRIPNEQLVLPHTEIDQTTGEVLVNTTGPDLVIDSLQAEEASKFAHLGWQFFSSAYLMVNQDANQFTLWKANPTALEDLVAVGTAAEEIRTWCAKGAQSSGGGGNQPETNGRGSGPSVSSSGSLSKGAIAGIAVSVLITCCVGAVLGVWLFKRRKSSGVEADVHPAEKKGQAVPADGLSNSVMYYQGKSELQGEGVHYQHLPNYGNEPGTTVKYELPG